MKTGQKVRIIHGKDGKNDAHGMIVETVGRCYKVQLYDDAQHLVNQYQIFHKSWLEAE